MKMSQEVPSIKKSTLIAFFFPFLAGGAYFAFVAVNHILKQPHIPLDIVIAIPFAFITLGTCCGIFGLGVFHTYEETCKLVRLGLKTAKDTEKIVRASKTMGEIHENI